VSFRPQIRWRLHSEKLKFDGVTLESSILHAGGAYHVQWRQLPPTVTDLATELQQTLGPDEGWENGKRPIGAGKIIGKSKLEPAAYQVCR